MQVKIQNRQVENPQITSTLYVLNSNISGASRAHINHILFPTDPGTIRLLKEGI
jgi:hypothetical protein